MPNKEKTEVHGTSDYMIQMGKKLLRYKFSCTEGNILLSDYTECHVLIAAVCFAFKNIVTASFAHYID